MEPSERRSRLGGDERLLYADLHNHSVLSDGAGDPERAFGAMRAAGLDVAALTDHASIPRADMDRLDPRAYPDAAALAVARMAPRSLDATGWARTATLADAADVPGQFTAIRGFEWTEPWLGHANVWFSSDYLHVRTPGRMDGLHRWLAEEATGSLFGYNHPGREPGRFGAFAVDGARSTALRTRMVALEVFNRYDDYLFEGWASGERSPLVACLEAGWRPGLVGVSDEHSRSYGLAGKGRTGLWANEHSRAGVREALLARRTFATREAGLALDATLGGTRMGSWLPSLGGVQALRVDIAAGPAYDGRPVDLQLLGPGPGRAPAVLATVAARVGAVAEVDITVPADPAWLVLRVADPARPAAALGPHGHPGTAYGVAYASPWFAGAPPAVR